MNSKTFASVAVVVLSILSPLRAEVKPNSLFTDNAVLQRDIAVPVFGTAKDGEKITVDFAGQKISTVAKDGTWRVALRPMKANATPQAMTIRGENTVTLANVLVGDVWVASGQSNMERQLGLRAGQKPIVGWEAEAAKADYPQIRQYYVPLRTAKKPSADANGKWTVCTPKTAIDFCAVGFFFARDIHETEKVPVGILFTAWGGTPAEVWASAESLKTMPAFRGAIDAMQKNADGAIKYADQLAKWYADNDPGSAKSGNWSVASLDTNGWTPVNVPSLFPDDFDGVFWYRHEFELPESWAGKSAVLDLGNIDDADTTWINGVKVGAMEQWDAQRHYNIPAGVLKAGRNVIAIRVLDNTGPGGFGGTPERMKLEIPNDSTMKPISLAGKWFSHKGVSLRDAPNLPEDFDNPSSFPKAPAMLYNAMLAPLQMFPIKGAIWYQGEANNGRDKEYQELFPLLIADWRRGWGIGDFPFLFVQIAPYSGMGPEIREAQMLTLAKSRNTAMAVTVDVGDAADIHPTRKKPVGERLALAARALAYKEKIEYSGPLFDSVKFEGGKAIISFTHLGGGLVAKDGELKGFTIAGADKKFVPAKAEIMDNTVVVSSDKIAAPAAVRYGWSNVPDVNLFNREGLPASPFRTDVE